LGSNCAVVNANGMGRQATHYYPFGKPIGNGESVNGSFQPYKYGGKEEETMHGLNLLDFEARMLDQMVPVYLKMDPLCEKYYSVSPYAYCGNNPINAIDPNGMDYYYMSDQGYMVLALKTDDNFDRLYAFNTDKNGNTKANTVDIKDRALLPQLVSGLDNGGHNAVTTNSTDAFNLFKFAADNSNVEWSLSGFNNSNGGTNFVFNTTHEKTQISNRNLLGNERSDLIFDVHSHPGTADYTKVASGYDLYFNKLKNGGSDAEYMNTYFHAAKAANKKWTSEYPKLFIYHKETSVLYNYNHKSSSVYAGKVTTPLSIKRLIRNYKIQP
jgi:RHS repeat-associated protein